MHIGKQIIIAFVGALFLASLFNIVFVIIPDMNMPYESGRVWYEPIDELPEGHVARIVTEDDFAAHPAFSVIFDEENQEHSIPMVYDVNRKGNPEPHISEREGWDIWTGYPYVEYNGQLYQCVWEIA